MSVLWMRAAIACEGCGQHFEVEIDEASSPRADWAMWDMAKDAVRGGMMAHGGPSCSVQDDKMLCPACTRETDEMAPDDDADPAPGG